MSRSNGIQLVSQRMTDDLLDNATGLGYGIAVHNAKEVAEVMRFALLAPLTKRP